MVITQTLPFMEISLILSSKYFEGPAVTATENKEGVMFKLGKGCHDGRRYVGDMGTVKADEFRF